MSRLQDFIGHQGLLAKLLEDPKNSLKAMGAATLGAPADILQLMGSIQAGARGGPAPQVPFTTDSLANKFGVEQTGPALAAMLLAPSPAGKVKASQKAMGLVFKADRISGRSLDAAATISKLPKVPSGHTRLYRASSPTVKFEDVFKPEVIKEFNPRNLKGKFFTDDLNFADYFRETYGRDAKIRYVDVPNEALKGRQTAPSQFVLDIE